MNELYANIAMEDVVMNRPTIRMYVDENGHQSLKGDLSKPDKRFLCVTGVIMRIETHDKILAANMNDLKLKYFGNADVILHRRELIPAKPPFQALSDPAIRKQYDSDFLNMVRSVNYRVISVVIDKMRLVDQFGLAYARDPYALALEYLMQRYQYWMQSCNGRFGSSFGDVLAEARGGGEDMLTKETYNIIYRGMGYNKLENAGEYFSSSQIKLKPKRDNVPGLQFVDLISHPARRYILSKNGLATDIKTSSFEAEIVNENNKNKFRRSPDGKIDGYGTVIYPS